MILHVLLVGQQHLDLQLGELLPEGEVGRFLGNQLVRVQLLLKGLLILVV